jgi:ABC-2 type transport system ATP-binding protein
LLRVEGLRKRYGAVPALEGCSLQVRRGQVVGFLGPNGAGKTTTMRAVLGVVAVDEGSITWDGEPLTAAHRRRIGYLPQERGLYPGMKVGEQLRYFAAISGIDDAEAARRAQWWLERLGLAGRCDSQLKDLSAGNQQRVQLAVALIHRPELLVLDEPFAGLDPTGVADMRAVLDDAAEGGAAVLFSSHQLDLVEDICRDVVVISRGRTIAAGAVDDLRAASERRRLFVRYAAGRPEPPTLPDGARFDRVDESAFAAVLASRVDPAPFVAAILGHGDVTELRFEPPGLEELFLELVR